MRGSQKCPGCGDLFTPVPAQAEIAGALRSVIHAHGPMAFPNRRAAAKRIQAALKALRRAEHDVHCLIVRTCEGMN